MVYADDIIMYMILILVAGIIPFGFTIWNLYNFFSKKKKNQKLAAVLTIVIGGLFYGMLFSVLFPGGGDWNEAVYVGEFHNSISSTFGASIEIPATLGLVGLLLLTFVKPEKLSPLVSALSIASVLIFTVVHIVYAIQIGKNVSGIGLLLYVYHGNLFLLSVSAVRKQIEYQLIFFKEHCKESEGKKAEEMKQKRRVSQWLYRKITRISQYTGLVFLCLFFLVAVLEILFIFTGQGADAPVKAFTDTADWTFSTQVPPPPMEYEGHYLCTVAAGGHKKLVKPLRLGTRRGHTIVVNRQLCIANAFEEYLQEKLPCFHKVVRGFYDKHGYPLSKLITNAYRADVVYLLMKPLEWMFLVFLYLFDCRPEQRIGRQYKIVSTH